ncbi:hypothetical protein [Howardella ureilytica]
MEQRELIKKLRNTAIAFVVMVAIMIPIAMVKDLNKYQGIGKLMKTYQKQ